MQRLEVSGAVRPIYGSLGVKRLIYSSSGACDCVVNYHIGRLVLSSLCVGAFGEAGIWWCSFCRLKHCFMW